MARVRQGGAVTEEEDGPSGISAGGRWAPIRFSSEQDPLLFCALPQGLLSLAVASLSCWPFTWLPWSYLRVWRKLHR